MYFNEFGMEGSLHEDVIEILFLSIFVQIGVVQKVSGTMAIVVTYREVGWSLDMDTTFTC